MKKILKWIALVAVAVILVVVGFIYSIFGHQQRPRTGPALGHGIEQVADGIATIFILDAGDGRVVLVDAGNTESGEPTLEALKRRGKTADDVAAIFITHAHPDHAASVARFPKAEVYAMQDEVAVAAGTEVYGSPFSKIMGAYNPHPFKVTRPLVDGQAVQIAKLKLTALEISGHTPGSAAYLAQGVLFTGDAFNITQELKIEGPVRAFTRDYPQAIASLRELLKKIESRRSEVEFVATSHSGVLAGESAIEQLRLFLAAQP